MKAIFLKHSYSENYIEQVFSETGNKIQRTEEAKSDLQILYWKIPYTKGTHAEIKNKIQSINKSFKLVAVKAAFTTYKTQLLCQNKDKIQQNELSSIVYKYSCEQCETCYIGETRRQFQQRIKEHLTGRPPSEISMHIHPPKKENFKIIYKTKYTKTAETLIIKHLISEKQKLMNNHRTSEFLLLF